MPPHYPTARRQRDPANSRFRAIIRDQPATKQSSNGLRSPTEVTIGVDQFFSDVTLGQRPCIVATVVEVSFVSFSDHRLAPRSAWSMACDTPFAAWTGEHLPPRPQRLPQTVATR